jgi:hypothetical protein
MNGTCLCKAVRFSVTPPTLWCAHCHCSLCRRSNGAAFVTWVGVAEDRFAVTSGAEDLVWYGSSSEGQRGFCRRCGSSILFRSTRWPGEVHVTRANFDGPIDREPALHAFFDTHVDWFPFEDGLPKRPE